MRYQISQQTDKRSKAISPAASLTQPRQPVDRTSPEAFSRLLSEHAEDRMRAFRLTERAREAAYDLGLKEQAKTFALMRAALDDRRLDRLVAKGLYEDREEARRGEFQKTKAEIDRKRKEAAFAKAGIKSRKKRQELAAKTDFGPRGTVAQVETQETVQAQIQALELERFQVLSGGPSKADFEFYLANRFIPEFNKLSPLFQLCPNCWHGFAVTHGNAGYCSDACEKATRDARQYETKKRAKKREAEKKLALDDQVRREMVTHQAGCVTCRSDRFCPKLRDIALRTDSPKSRSVRTTGLVSLDLAEAERAKRATR
jgi:hypothetical protein